MTDDLGSTPTDREVGSLLIHLARRMADAWADGDEVTANRWARIAFKVRGTGDYVDALTPAEQRQAGYREDAGR